MYQKTPVGENPFVPSTDHLTFLYHYTTIQIFLDHILQTGQLRLSPMATVNDPKEARFVSASGATTDDPSPWTHRLAEFHEQYIKVLCLSKDYEQRKITYSPRFVGYIKPAMWAYYGDNHKGVCLVFDRAKLTAQFSQHFIGALYKIHADVNYERHTHVSPNEMRSIYMHWTIAGHDFDPVELQRDFSATVLENLRKHYDKMFFRKHGDWTHEQEYRYLVASDEPGYEFIPFADSLVGLAIGCHAERQQVVTLMEVCANVGLHTSWLSIDDFT